RNAASAGPRHAHHDGETPMRLKGPAVATGIVLCLASLVRSQDAVDLGLLDRIKSESFARSQVMDHLHYLTDVHGPRLTGSPPFQKDPKWTKGRPGEAARGH